VFARKENTEESEYEIDGKTPIPIITLYFAKLTFLFWVKFSGLAARKPEIILS
jgi:hypothetical protein